MSTVTFDTDALIQKLVESGIVNDQARAIVRVLVEAQHDLATKHDLIDLENRLVIKLGAMMAVSVGIVVAMVKIL
jgi:hypothetical protein